VEVLKFILKSLLDGKNFPVPDFGYLEVRAVSGRRTVFFVPKTTDNESYASQLEEYDKRGVETLITKPLKEGKEVSLPEMGIFKPFVKGDGSIRVSFIPSPALRSKLNGTDTESREIESSAKSDLNGFSSEKSIKSDKIEAQEVALSEEEVSSEILPVIVEKKDKVAFESKSKMSGSDKKTRTSKVGDVIVPDDDDTSNKHGRGNNGRSGRTRNLAGWLLAIVIVISVLVILFQVFNKGPKELGNETNNTASESSLDLPSLAADHYGNPVYWVYIYEANKDRLHLKSPVNINISDTSLIIPDIQADYGIELTDSMEIQIAKALGEVILEQINK
jgi:nucleoid-associated protein YgaU/nucleoid DNA-binding protein